MLNLKKILFIISCCITSIATADIHYPEVSSQPAAQTLFDQGMLNYYAYLYVQAEADFRKALTYDANCGMCYWGLALAKKQQALELGKPFATVGYAEINQASALVKPTNDFYYEIVRATKDSFSADPDASSKQLHTQFINNLRSIAFKYQNNPQWYQESLALFVDAIAYYGNVDDGKDNLFLNHCSRLSANDYKQEALDHLVPMLQNNAYPDHPGLLHTYIHMAERDVNDTLGLVVAKKLPQFSQGTIAHYTHMPTHIYWRRGMYQEAIQANFDAIDIDENYFRQNGVGLNAYYYEYHYLHSHHFLVALGILTNNYELALHYAQLIKNLMNIDRMEGLQDYRDTFLSLEHVVLARFNQWQELLNLETPAASNELALLLIDFSRALAYLNLGNEQSFQLLFKQLQNRVYTRTNMLELQTLVTSYLTAVDMRRHHASKAEIERIFLTHHVAEIEEKLAAMNPPLWFFPYKAFLESI